MNWNACWMSLLQVNILTIRVGLVSLRYKSTAGLIYIFWALFWHQVNAHMRLCTIMNVCVCVHAHVRKRNTKYVLTRRQIWLEKYDLFLKNIVCRFIWVNKVLIFPLETVQFHYLPPQWYVESTSNCSLFRLADFQENH